MLDLQELAELFEAHKADAQQPIKSFEIGGEPFDFDQQAAVMGVVNLSPGSWYRESVCLSPESAIQRGFVLFAQGAHIIDVGAESTLADAERVPAQSQIEQLDPIVTELSKAGVPVSVETYEPSVAETMLERGAEFINLTGTEHADAIYDAVAAHDAGVIICHIAGANVREVHELNLSENPISAVFDYFEKQIESATSSGVERIFVDPGLGFYYPNLQDGQIRVRHQIQTFLNSFRLRKLGFPICHALPHAFEYFKDEVRSAEPFFAVLAALGKTNLFRTHEVSRVRAVLDVLQA
tara:strand:- start:3361 stop:4245 length:885 start_codon:yes stop_codon:yes gene_type:complete